MAPDVIAMNCEHTINSRRDIVRDNILNYFIYLQFPSGNLRMFNEVKTSGNVGESIE